MVESLNTKESGISPVIGVVLLVAIVVVLAGVLGVVAFDLAGSPSQPAQVGVVTEEKQDGFLIRVNSNPEDVEVVVRKNGTDVETIKNPGSSVTIPVFSNDKVTVIGVNSDGETVIKDYVAGKTLATVSGTASYNPPAEGITVTQLDGTGSVIAETKTKKNGEFIFGQEGDSYKVNGYDVTTTVSSGVDIELDSSDIANNGDNIAEVLMDTDASGNYKVDSTSDLYSARIVANSNYKLISDIDASHTELWNNGAGWNPIGTYSKSFGGSINGNGHTVANLTMNENSRSTPVGMVGVTSSSATIQNISLENVDIVVNNGPFYAAGGAIGNAETGVTVTNVSVSGTVKKQSSTVGGVIGSNGTDVSNLSSSATVIGENTVGGIVGKLNYRTISESSFTGEVRGAAETGGIVGIITNSGSVKKSYSTGTVVAEPVPSGSFTSPRYIGGIAGNVKEESLVENSYSTATIKDNSTHSSVGGVAGNLQQATVRQSYAAGSVSGAGTKVGCAIGSLVSYDYGPDAVAQDIYCDTSVAGQSSVIQYVDDDGTPSNISKSNISGSTDFKGTDASSNMSGFDFTSVWKTIEGDYPQIQGNEE